MTQTRHTFQLRRHLLAAAVALVGLPAVAGPAFAQDVAKPDPSAATAKGLDALSDDRLYNELAGRNLKNLLDRAMDQNNVPKEEREGIVSRMALSRLRGDISTIPLEERRRLIGDFVAGLDKMLPTATDPKALIGDANTLIDAAVREDMSLLEYWGENERTQARLRPVAEATVKMLDRAAKLADDRATKLVNNWNANDPTMATQWQALDDQKRIAEYTGNIIDYPVALSIDKADPQRAVIAKKAMDYLQQFDSEDNPDRSFIRFMLGKLHLAIGQPDDYKAAREQFQWVIDNGDKANPAALYEAYTFRTITEILAGDLPAAQTQFDRMQSYAKVNSLTGPSYDALNQTLQYRLLALQAGQEQNPQTRQRLNNEAAKVLSALIQQQPGLRTIIFEQLATRVEPTAPVKELQSLLLQALISKGESEYQKKDDASVNKDVLMRAVDAARELATRDPKTDPAVTPELLKTASFVVPFFLDKAGQKAQAAEAYVDFAIKYKDDADKAPTALNNAIALVGKLRSDDATKADAEVIRAYEKVLATAVAPPFNRNEFAFEYGVRLLNPQNHDYAKAIELLKKVPPDAKSADVVPYYTMLATNGLIDELKPDDPRRPELLTQIQTLADKVTAASTVKLQQAGTDQERLVAKSRLASTRLLAAKLAYRDQKDPARAVTLLEGFEQAAEGLPNSADLLGQALLIRVQALISTGDTSKATGALVALAERRPEQAGGIVYNLLTKLDEDITAAEASGNADRAAELKRNQAALTPFLVSWSKENKNPEIRKSWYRYSVFDADTQYKAADSTADKAKRDELLKNAAARLKELQSPENYKKFVAGLPKAYQATPPAYDRQVLIGLGRVEYALGNYQEAYGAFGKLLQDKTIGGATLESTNDAGIRVTKDNPDYWESNLRFIQSNVALKQNVDGMKNYLKGLYAVWGSDIGGQRWGTEYKKLHDALIPEVEIKASAGPTTTPA